MIGLKGDDLADEVRHAFGGLLAGAHSVARRRDLRSDALGYDPVLWRRFADAGWLSARVPAELGGAGLSAAATAPILDLAGAQLVPEPILAGALWPSLLLASSGPARELLPGVASGARRVAVAWQEEAGQVDPGATLRTKVDAGRVTGVKSFVVGGAGADTLLVTAATARSKLQVVLVEAGASGVSIDPVRQIDGSVATSVTLDAAPVEREVCDADAFARALDEARILLAVQLLGLAREALRITVEYAGTRRQFDRPIGSFQALQHRMARFACRIRLSEAICDAALAVLDEPAAVPEAAHQHAAAAKASAVETALEVAQGAIQIHGAIGYTDDADIGLYLATALALSPWLGSAEAMQARFLACAQVMADA